MHFDSAILEQKEEKSENIRNIENTEEKLRKLSIFVENQQSNLHSIKKKMKYLWLESSCMNNFD